MPEAPETHHHHTGHRWIDYVIAGTALLVSIVSLWLAIGHGRTMERLVAANSWPNVGEVTEISPKGGGVRFSIALANSGVGPAFVETLEVWRDGRAFASVGDLLRDVRAALGDTSPSMELSGNSVVGTVLPSRATVRVLDVVLPGPSAASTARLVPLASGLRTRVCFCSVFDECYVADSAATRPRPRAVDSCPAVAVRFNDDLATAIRQPAAARPGDSAAARP